MKLYSGNKKSVYALIGLGTFAAYMVYSQLLSGPGYKPVTPQTARPEAADSAADGSSEKGGPDISQAKGKISKASPSKSKNGEFHPVYIAKKKEDRPDVSAIDPTIRFDLLDRALQVPQAGAERDLFQISKAPPVKQVAEVLKGNEPVIHPYIPVGPRQPPKPMPPPPPPPPAPLVVPFKFYGTSAVHPDGKRTAYFIIPGSSPETDEIFMADEGDVVKKRYRIVQIAVDKVVVEDIMDKRRAPLNMEKENTQ